MATRCKAIGVTTGGTLVDVSFHVFNRIYTLSLTPDEADSLAVALDDAITLTQLASGPCGPDNNKF